MTRLIQNNRWNRALLQRSGIRDRFVAPTLADEIMPVVIVDDVREALQETDQHTIRWSCVSGGTPDPVNFNWIGFQNFTDESSIAIIRELWIDHQNVGGIRGGALLGWCQEAINGAGQRGRLHNSLLGTVGTVGQRLSAFNTAVELGGIGLHPFSTMARVNVPTDDTVILRFDQLIVKPGVSFVVRGAINTDIDVTFVWDEVPRGQ